MNEITVLDKNQIKKKIYTLRGLQVIIDHDLAEFYDVETKRLNEQVNRNMDRFPKDFMFQLNNCDLESLRSQNIISSDDPLRSQNATLENGRGKHRKYLPYAFTEQGVASLSGILKSKKAAQVHVQIMRAFVAMRTFIASNAQIFQRLDKHDQKFLEYDGKFEKIFDALESKELIPQKGIFFEGQIFDAYKFISDIIRSAKKSIVLVDNFVDDSVLTLFSKKNENIEAIIFTKKISKKLSLDLERYNSQYPYIEIKEFKSSHDRFLIVDGKEVYHIGASLKDLGKKWFAFSKFDKEAFRKVKMMLREFIFYEKPRPKVLNSTMRCTI
jgi:hypothetical protein